ncbi:hypothetical protein CA13_19750 [Planctomycetes bacterium CA13]|uniref:Uncharacterized protein n=1 Tax=Novipirellula herctigrandis TaxID=2527986 RepID=A0A5C5Z061_9BACT|nr:hypothetical protein CA13_19750 [Planctomycetes bacterium CA13]
MSLLNRHCIRAIVLNGFPGEWVLGIELVVLPREYVRRSRLLRSQLHGASDGGDLGVLFVGDFDGLGVGARAEGFSGTAGEIED